MRGKTPRPDIPPPSDPRFKDKARELLQQLIGQRGDKLDRAVTFRDLIESGLAKTLEGFGGRLTTGQDPTDLISPGVPRPDRSVPPAPRNLKAVGGVGTALITWDSPAYSNHAFTEVARSISQNFGAANIMGSSPSRGYTDVTGNSGKFFYWARNVSTADVSGPWSGPVSAVVESTADDVLRNIEGQVDENMLVQSLTDRLSGIEENSSQIQQLSDEFTVKIDNAGRVAGFGLAFDDGASTFAVAADQVFFVDPGGGTAFDPNKDYASQAELDNTQFIFGYATVQGQKRFGINVPAAIRNATIDFAKIDLATVNNLNVTQLATFRDAVFNGVTSVFDIEVQERGVIKSADYAQGNMGFLIGEDGFAEFNGVTVRGTVDASTVTGSEIIGGRIISSDRVIPTDLDSGNNVFLADAGLIAYRESKKLFLSNPVVDFVVDIVSANNSNTQNTRRYKSTTVPLSIEIFHNALEQSLVATDNFLKGFEIRVFRGATLLRNSGPFSFASVSTTNVFNSSGVFIMPRFVSPDMSSVQGLNPAELNDGFLAYAVTATGVGSTGGRNPEQVVITGALKYEITVDVPGFSGDSQLVVQIEALTELSAPSASYENFANQFIINVESLADNR